MHKGSEAKDLMKHTKVCSKCGIELPISEFYEGQYWCKGCKIQWNKDNIDKVLQYQRKHLKQFEGRYIYCIYDITGVVMYTGSTVNIKRRSDKHIYCHSNISEYMEHDRWLAIKYIRLSEDITVNELKYLEQQFINHYEPLLNEKNACVSLDFIEGDRLAYLMDLSYDIIDSFEEEASIWKVNNHINK